MRKTVRWVIVAALAVTSVAAGSGASATPQPPAVSDYTAVYPVSWQGQVWLGRESGVTKQGPAPNYWLSTPQTAFTDSSGALHLIAEQVGSQYYSVGIQSTKSDYGYGTYTVVVNTPLASLDPMAVVGMYTYNRNYLPGRDEIDVELSRWGQPSPTFNNSQFVVQPWHIKNHLNAFFSPTTHTPLTFQWQWTKSAVYFREYDGVLPGAKLIKKWTCASFSPAPLTGTKMNFNLWFARGQAPYNRQAQEVVFRSFTYGPGTG